MTTLAIAPTVEAYAAAFRAEQAHEYPVVDQFERRAGYRLDRDRLESAARVLACPLKAHPPNWQHGRVLYTIARAYLATHAEPVTLLDIGTAKGFSALCLQWALLDSGRPGAVVSVDVLDPAGRERRNSVAEVEGPTTLAAILAPWPEAGAITFLKSTGVEWLKQHPARVHVAFVDGKHTGAVVYQEGTLLAQRQEPGDVVVFDDVQIDGVAAAVKELRKVYALEELIVTDHRRYAIGVRRG